MAFLAYCGCVVSVAGMLFDRPAPDEGGGGDFGDSDREHGGGERGKSAKLAEPVFLRQQDVPPGLEQLHGCT